MDYARYDMGIYNDCRGLFFSRSLDGLSDPLDLCAGDCGDGTGDDAGESGGGHRPPVHLRMVGVYKQACEKSTGEPVGIAAGVDYLALHNRILVDGRILLGDGGVLVYHRDRLELPVGGKPLCHLRCPGVPVKHRRHVVLIGDENVHRRK